MLPVLFQLLRNSETGHPGFPPVLLVLYRATASFKGRRDQKLQTAFRLPELRIWKQTEIPEGHLYTNLDLTEDLNVNRFPLRRQLNILKGGFKISVHEGRLRPALIRFIFSILYPVLHICAIF